ncbi:MAG: sodium-extruding oxaloacetate decarboxylase subunit alpha [Clostridiales bacterium]|nr:sodium-extruding oxaloacetate decarboxylase subunit alpha [Clostridiales bacterium]
MANKINITDTILRDAHQSQAATRMRTEDMLPILDKMDKVGFYSVECWGGATYDTCLRFLNEDPWDRLRKLREGFSDTKLQMLLRGQNLLGYKHYADDVVDMFVKKAIENGIDIIRIFDALNDVRNLEQAIKSTKKYKGICEAAISYTTSPVHNTEYFVNLSKTLAKMGADIICIKDMANLLLPYDAYELVKAIKSEVNLPLHIHTHNTAGTGDMVYLKAIEAGADIIDTSISSLANGTSQPTTESIVATLQGTKYDTGLDLKLLNEISKYFDKVSERLSNDGFLNKKVLKTDINALIYQVPGGMLSNLINQLKEQGASDKLDEVLTEVPKVRKDLGYPPLVTPTSQIVGTQAVLNVIAGERYKMVSNETKGLLKGEYGKLPAEPDAEVIKKCIGDAERITVRPADLLKPEYENYKKEMQKYYTKEEDVLSYCMFPQVSEKFFKWRQEQHARKFTITVNGEKYEVEVEDLDYVKPQTPQVVQEVKVETKPEAKVVKPTQKPTRAGSGKPLIAPIPGTVLDFKVKSGDKVKVGQPIIILEAMKVENEIAADADGIVTILTSKGASVESGDTLATIE